MIAVELNPPRKPSVFRLFLIKKGLLGGGDAGGLCLVKVVKVAYLIRRIGASVAGVCVLVLPDLFHRAKTRFWKPSHASNLAKVSKKDTFLSSNWCAADGGFCMQPESTRSNHVQNSPSALSFFSFTVQLLQLL